MVWNFSIWKTLQCATIFGSRSIHACKTLVKLDTKKKCGSARYQGKSRLGRQIEASFRTSPKIRPRLKFALLKSYIFHEICIVGTPRLYIISNKIIIWITHRNGDHYYFIVGNICMLSNDIWLLNSLSIDYAPHA